MPDPVSRRAFLAGGSVVLAGSACLAAFPFSPASAAAAIRAGGHVTLYMGVPEWDGSGKAVPYRPSHASKRCAIDPGNWGIF